ncbi:MAG: glycosyltransferase family 1 protein [Bryobacteraceae bacterium]|nr:glycosyltransferase family 1 protein [Bryobacteraceae bacterium]
MSFRRTVGFDATYSLDREPTGVSVYSRESMRAIERLAPAGEFRRYYRPHRFARGLALGGARLLLESFAPRVEIFHGLNQRLPRAKRGKFVATFHDLFVMTGEYSTPEFRERFTRFSREAAERADAIIAVSSFTAGQVEELLGVPRSRIRVVYHGVHPPPHAAPIASREPWILSVGAIQDRKNLVRLCAAFERVPAGWRWKIAGGLGYGSPAILDRIERSSRRADIDLLGYASDEQLRELYSRCSVLAFPSLGEGFGIPVIEAMAAGLPVLTSTVGAMAEVACGAAVLADPENVDSIAEGLLVLMQSQELRERYAAVGRARAKDLSWERAARETLAVYEGL